MTVLVTGSSGFVGTNLIKQLKKIGFKNIIGVDKKPPQLDHILDNFYQLDIANESFIDNIVSLIPDKIDYIFHLAAQTSSRVSEENSYLDISTNCFGTSQIIKFAELKGQKSKIFPKIIFMSSMAIYGNSKLPFKETMRPKPNSVYGISKVFGEMLLEKYKENGGEYIITRLFNCYGPYQDMTNDKQGMLSIFLNQGVEFGEYSVTGSLNRTRDFIYIDDVVKIITNESFLKLNATTLNLCSGFEISVKKLIEEISNIIDIPKNNIKINQLGNHAGDTNRSLGDFTKLHQCLIGSEISDFKLTPLSVGIRKFKEYLDGL